ncbi:putative tRNA/rRNA methyltransferase [Thalassocella blandensis]|nr:putative tRNA/rRNA methyltransferase [Thalassocella blandensis]
MTEQNPDYQQRKKFFDQLLTIYGRKPVLEALQTSDVEVYRLHLAESNKPASILSDIEKLAKKKGAEILHHDRKALSFISKNQKQDQGVAVDLKLKGFQDLDDFLLEIPAPSTQHSHTTQPMDIIALDNVTNPQNLGMIIRSACASPITALLIPRKGCAKLDSLVIKASAGTLFKAKVIRCDALSTSLEKLKTLGFNVVGLDVNAAESLGKYHSDSGSVFVLGNETTGMSPEVKSQCNQSVKIPMHNQVESLNVAVTAALIAFRNAL